MDLQGVAELLEPFAQLATALGVVIAVAAYFLEIRRSHRDQALRRFNDLNQQYREWLLLLFTSLSFISWSRTRREPQCGRPGKAQSGPVRG